MPHQFLITWSNEGLEFVGDYTEYVQDKMWADLQGKKPTVSFPNLMHLELRARYNAQRHYEIYLINATDGITVEDIQTMFRNDPQGTADLIRNRGHKYYSDRVETTRVKIV